MREKEAAYSSVTDPWIKKYKLTGEASERPRYKAAKRERGRGVVVEERDGVRRVFVLDVWDVLYSLALVQSPLPDQAGRL